MSSPATRAPLATTFALPLLLFACALHAQSSGLERGPEPAVGISLEEKDKLRAEKMRLDQRFSGVERTFTDFNTECRRVDKENAAQITACQNQRKELIEFARAYWKAFCTYKDNNRAALEAAITPRRAEVREKTEQARRVGKAISATTRANEEWSEVSEEQRNAMKEQALSSAVSFALAGGAKVLEFGGNKLIGPVWEKTAATKAIDALKRKGVTDPALLHQLEMLPQGGTLVEKHKSITFMAEWIQGRLDLAKNIKDAGKAKEEFEKLWASTETLLAVTDSVLKVAEAAGVAGAALPMVSASIAGLPGAIMIGGHSAIGYFWTHQYMLELAGLEDFQLLQVQLARDGIEIAVGHLNELKAQLATYTGDRRCAAPAG